VIDEAAIVTVGVVNSSKVSECSRVTNIFIVGYMSLESVN